MTLPTNDDFVNCELSIEELEAIAAGGFWSTLELLKGAGYVLIGAAYVGGAAAIGLGIVAGLGAIARGQRGVVSVNGHVQ